jgi:hypothetical protein
MYILIIIFVALLIGNIIFILYKTTQVREYRAHVLRHEDYGDKDHWVLHQARTMVKHGHVIAKGHASKFVLFLVKEWFVIVHKVNGFIRRKYPEIAYLIGDKTHIKQSKDVEASAFMESMKNSKQDTGTHRIDDTLDIK